MTRGRLIVAAVLLVAGLHIGVAALAGAFDDDEDEARDAAERYAKALTDGSGQALTALACRRPSPGEVKAFEAMAKGSALKWRVLAPPQIDEHDGAVARGTLRATERGRHQDYPFSLHLRDGAWCANYNWSTLTKPR